MVLRYIPFLCASIVSADAVHAHSETLRADAGRQPNVLFLAIDDLNDWVGALGGHPQAKTPHLDRLISQSILFRNAHCAAPVCSASRHALLSGLRPSTTGWYSNSSKDPKSYVRTLGETVPMPTHFKHNGYRTMAAGKIFHKGTSDVKGYDYWNETRPKYKWPKDLAARGHGYQGNSGGHFHPFPPDGGAIYQKFQEGVAGQSLCWGALEKEDMPPEGMPDEQIAAWAVERLKQEHDKPFFLAVGFVRPHVPYTAPKEYFDLYPADDIVMPQVPTDEMDDIPLWGKAMAYGTIEGGDHRAVLDIGPDYWKNMVRAYLACVSFVDAQAGKVLDALEASPHADNTIIVFWSDHGQHLGEKLHWRKMALWEESTRVPLAIRLPKSINAGRSYFIQNAADINPRDRWSGTPLDDAYRHGHAEVAQRLKDHGGVRGEMDIDETVHCTAATTDQTTVSNSIIESIYAASQGNLAALQRLVARGVVLTDADYDLRTPLHLAAAEGHADVVQYFIDHELELSSRDRWGNTPLDDARRHGRHQVIELLVAATEGE